MQAGTYQAKIMDWGVKHYTEKDEYKLFVKFEILGAADKNDQYITWHGSLDDSPRTSKSGKEYTMLNMTRMNLKTLGYKYGEDLEAIINQPNPFDMDEVFTLDVATFQTNNGRPGVYVRSFESALRPKEQGSSSVKTLEKNDASSYLAQLMGRTGLKKVSNGQPVDTSDIPF